jgi:hypothetical protein
LIIIIQIFRDCTAGGANDKNVAARYTAGDLKRTTLMLLTESIIKKRADTVVAHERPKCRREGVIFDSS